MIRHKSRISFYGITCVASVTPNFNVNFATIDDIFVISSYSVPTDNSAHLFPNVAAFAENIETFTSPQFQYYIN